MGVHVRYLTPSDKPDWLGLFDAYIAFYEASVPPDVIEIAFARLLAAREQVGLVAAGDDGKPVGIAHLLFHASTWSATSYCYLEDLYVDPAVRGGGVGRALIEAAYREADRRGASRTYWVTRGDNAAARRLYDQVAAVTPFVQYRR